MIDRNKWESWAKQWEDKLPNLAKALRNKELQETCNEIQSIELYARMQERQLIVYTIESTLMDEDFSEDYKTALKDEVQNHKIAIEEYKQELRKLTNL